MRILLIRHAEPDYEHNTLTPNGFKEAEALGEVYRNFQFDEAYCSPLNRAKLTAEAFMMHHPEKGIVVKDWLAEFDPLVRVPYTDEDVYTWDFPPAEFVKEEAFFSGDKYFTSSWLQSDALKKRYREAAEGLDAVLEHNGYRRNGRNYDVLNSNTRTVLFFCHFGMMSVLMSHLLHIPYVLLAQHFECQPTGITTIVTEERERGLAQFRCLRYSDVSHLAASGLQPSFSGRFCEIFDSPERH